MLLLSACGTKSPSTFVSKGEWITFVSDRDGNLEIYVMKPDGTEQTRLTDNSANDKSPIWSPDGSRIAFLSDRDGNYDIHIMKLDGTNQTNLTNTSEVETNPTWSPNNKQIAFECYADPKNSDICLVNSDGSKYTNLTKSSFDETEPVWSPDGTQIAFLSDQAGNTDIYMMDVDGTNQIQLTNSTAVEGNINWSPDGKKIAFYAEENANGKIYRINADGSEITCLTEEMPGIWSLDYPQGFSDHRWSPDGDMLVYTYWIMREITFSTQGTSIDMSSFIFVMNADGTSQIRLAGDDNMAIDDTPEWSPNGEQIVFITQRDGNQEIYKVNVDGSGLTRLTTNEAKDFNPIWQP
jgi:Tol biopolymer transport system component